MSIEGIQRVEKELEDVPVGWTVERSRTDLWHASIKGPKGTPYAGGTFVVGIFIPSDYPLKPPKVSFNTKIFHPNIYNGQILLDILSPPRKLPPPPPGKSLPPELLNRRCWEPHLTMSMVLQSISSLFANPVLSGENVADIANTYLRFREEFDKTAAEWTRQYAT